MTVQRIDCEHFDLRGAARMAREGFGHCERAGRAWQFFGATYQRQCSLFQAAPQQQALARREWHNGLRSGPGMLTPTEAA